jgi:hypothetical protein
MEIVKVKKKDLQMAKLKVNYLEKQKVKLMHLVIVMVNMMGLLMETLKVNYLVKQMD